MSLISRFLEIGFTRFQQAPCKSLPYWFRTCWFSVPDQTLHCMKVSNSFVKIPAVRLYSLRHLCINQVWFRLISLRRTLTAEPTFKTLKRVADTQLYVCQLAHPPRTLSDRRRTELPINSAVLVQDETEALLLAPVSWIEWDHLRSSSNCSKRQICLLICQCPFLIPRKWLGPERRRFATTDTCGHSIYIRSTKIFQM